MNPEAGPSNAAVQTSVGLVASNGNGRRGEFRWKRRETLDEEKAPKGKPQGRCRHEIRPASCAREKAVERVIKP